MVTRKATYGLTGSASDPASDWQWDQSCEGGPWSFWASTQNSSFVAYAGNYTLDWRLFARRTSDGATNYGFASTRVCIPYNPATCVVPPNVAGVTGSTAAEHFGSGLWVGVRGPLGNAPVRFYSFTGRHDQDWAMGDRPNVLAEEAVTWTGATGVGVGAVRVSSRRESPSAGLQVFRVSGRIEGVAPPREVAVALAVDPDLGAPHDDRLRFDADLGLVTVYDGGATLFGYLALPSGAVGDVRVRQFDLGAAEEPRRGSDAYAAMLETSFRSDRQTDVRFLLTVPAVPVAADGAFAATFAVLTAGSQGALRALAAAARSQYGLSAGLRR
jgi:hypothetical protein